MLINIGERLKETSSLSVAEYGILCYLQSMGCAKVDDKALKGLLESIRRKKGEVYLRNIEVVCEEYGSEQEANTLQKLTNKKVPKCAKFEDEYMV